MTKQKPHKYHYGNVPFEVPKGWKWVTFGSICKKLTDGSHNPPPKRPKGYIVISAQNIKNGRIVFTDKDRYTDESGFQKENPRTQISKGDIILGIIGGSIGNVGIYEHSEPVIAQRSISIIDTYASNLFCFYLLQSQIFQSLFLEKSIGNAQAGVYLGELEKLCIPLPPLVEQQRIVGEIERWFTLIAQIEQGKSDLQTAIKQAKCKILDLAIHGKLIPQDPNDEPASKLLKRINPKAEITSDNEHDRKLPTGWCICRLDSLCKIRGGKRIPHGMSFANKKTKHIYIRVTDMKQNTIVTSDLKYIDDEVYEQIKNYKIYATDLYLTIAGTIGNVGIIPIEVDGMNLTENAVRLTNIICYKKFLLYALLSSSSQEHFKSRFHQVAQPKLSIETTSATQIPLPPLLEQQRIVQKVEKLFSILDNIQEFLEV